MLDNIPRSLYDDLVIVLYSEEFSAWLAELSEMNQGESESIIKVISLLRIEGMALRYPWSSALKGTKFAFRELRPRRGESPYRVIYAFDPDRNAALLIGGHKEHGVYSFGLRRAEAIWEQHVAAVKRRLAEESKKRGNK